MSVLTRKQFLRVAVTVSAAVAVGCGDDESGTGATGGAGGNASGGGEVGGSGGSSTGGSSAGGSGTGGSSSGGSSAGGSGGGGVIPNCDDGALVEISANHAMPHELVINGADLMLAGDIPLSVSAGGSPSHTHDLVLTDADKQTLFNSGSVFVTTSMDNGHTHTITFSCM